MIEKLEKLNVRSAAYLVKVFDSSSFAADPSSPLEQSALIAKPCLIFRVASSVQCSVMCWGGGNQQRLASIGIQASH